MCPIPVIELAKRIWDVPVGSTLRVLADDPAARLDIPAWSELREHTYLGEEPAPERGEGAVAYLVRRGTSCEPIAERATPAPQPRPENNPPRREPDAARHRPIGD